MTRTTPSLAAALLLLGLSAAHGPGAAAQSLSSDQIIRQLQPGSRGIRPVGPAAPPPAAAAPAAAPSTRSPAPARPAAPPVAQATAASVDLTVQFASGSAELTPQAARTLDELGRALSSTSLAGFRFRIEGHTDTVGTPDGNKALSDQRAAKVLDYLATHWNVDRTRLTSVGMGQENLLVQTGPGVAQPRNRRVTVINLGA